MGPIYTGLEYDDAQWNFAFEGIAGQRVYLRTAAVVDATGSALEDAIIQLLDPDGEALADADDRNLWGGDLQAELRGVVLPEDGRYVVRVTAGSGEIPRRASVSDHGGYSIYVSVSP